MEREKAGYRIAAQALATGPTTTREGFFSLTLTGKFELYSCKCSFLGFFKRGDLGYFASFSSCSAQCGRCCVRCIVSTEESKDWSGNCPTSTQSKALSACISGQRQLSTGKGASRAHLIDAIPLLRMLYQLAFSLSSLPTTDGPNRRLRILVEALSTLQQKATVF